MTALLRANPVEYSSLLAGPIGLVVVVQHFIRTHEQLVRITLDR
jgi:hypothetical protein